MRKPKTASEPKRREVLIALGTGGLAVATICLLPKTGTADAPAVAEAIRNLIGDKTPEEGRVSVELTQIAENGNSVPLSIEVDSPMTEQDHCKAVHVFAELNPLPNVASFNFTPACGKAAASTRMRLARTQKVVAVAEMSDGSVYMTTAEVTVTIGGCGA